VRLIVSMSFCFLVPDSVSVSVRRRSIRRRVSLLEVFVMGWFYPSEVSSRRELLDMLSSDSAAFVRSRRYCCGNVLWILWEPVGAAAPVSDPWIGCYLLHRCGGRWGYKALCEESGPFYWSCPPAFLEAAPVVNAEWREGVRAYWKRRAAKRAERAALRRSWGDIPRRVPRGWSSV
jgi:hypothetical protein